MITDSFGSPSLGQGIALQAQPKDYSGQIVKGIVAGQERKAKAEQKKLDAELKDQAELDEALSKFKPDGTGLKAFDPQRQKIAKEYFDTIRDLKQKGKSVKGSVEYREAEWKAQNEFNKLKFLEDRYKKELDFIATHKNDNRFQADERRLQALENPDEYLSLSGGDIYNNIGPLFEELPQYNIMKDMADMQKTVKPEVIGKTYLTTLSDGTQTIAYDETSEFDQEKIDQAWNRFKTFDSVQAEAKKLVDRNFYPDMNSALSALELDFKRPFENSRKIKAKQKFEKDDRANIGGIGGGLGDKNVNWAYGVSDISNEYSKGKQIGIVSAYVFGGGPARDILKYYKSQDPKLDIYNPEVIRRTIEKYNALPETYEPKKSLIAQNPANNKIAQIPVVPTEFKAPSSLKTADVLSFNPGKTIDDQKLIKIQLPGSNEAIDAKPTAVVRSKDGKERYFLVAIPNIDGSGYTNAIADFEPNKSSVGLAYGVDPSRWDETIDYWKKTGSGSGASLIKKEQGGLVEPKTVSQKFHNKSKNMTKFVYSDGSEEIFNGII